MQNQLDGIAEVPMWPAKSAICLECRMVFGKRESCGQGEHHAADLASARGRESLARARWDRDLDGTPRAIAAASRALLTLLVAAFGATWLWVILRAPSILWSMAAMLSLAALVPAFLLASSRRLSLRSFLASEQGPLGASAPPPLLLDGQPIIGTIVDGAPAPAPLSGKSCVAYRVNLHHRGARPSTLIACEAATRPLTIATDDGQRIEVPAGNAVLDGPAEVVDAEPDRLRSYLARLHLIGVRGERLLELDEVRELRFELGDRVVVHGELRPMHDSRAEPATYREPPPHKLVPAGPAKLERLS